MPLQRKNWLIYLSLFFLSIFFFYFIYWLFVGRFYEITEDAYVSGNQIEVMPQISGHVTQVFADETDFVTKGQPLVVLDRADVYLALKNAENQLALTVRQVAQLYKKVDQLKANFMLQQTNFNKAEEDLKRRQGLVVNQTISREAIAHSKLAVKSALAAMNLAKNQLEAGKDLVVKSDLYHHPQILQAENNFRNAFLNWQRTTIAAPETGYVAKRIVQVGQHIDINSVLMIIVPLNQLWVIANFKESQLSHIQPGQPVKLISDTYGNKVNFTGKVIGLNPGAGNSFDLLPPQNATGNWIKIVQRLPVRISIDSETLKKYPLRLGLSMTARVDTRARNITLKKVTNKNQHLIDDQLSLLKTADQIINKILAQNATNACCD